jgi:hypothetical protein
MSLPIGKDLTFRSDVKIEAVQQDFDEIGLLGIVEKGEISTKEELKILQMAVCLTTPSVYDLFCENGVGEWGNSYFFINNRSDFLHSAFSSQLQETSIQEFVNSLLKTFWHYVSEEQKNCWKMFFDENKLQVPEKATEEDKELTEKFLQFLVSQNLN